MKKSLAILCALLFVLPLCAPAKAVEGISAESYVLTDAATGRILASRGADEERPVASTTKILTCLVALEEADPGATVAVPKEAVGTEGSSMYLYAGEKLTVLDLLYGLMLESANDAAVTLAICVSGSVPAFADRMNEKAARLGMEHSHFENPHGLPAEGHVSTARDLAILFRAALGNPLFAEIVGTARKTIAIGEGKTQVLVNHNRLLHSFPDCIGGKTGYTVSAGRCLVSAARRQGATLIAVTLAAPRDWQDHKTLFEYGFSLYETKTYSPGSLRVTLPVSGGVAGEAAFSNRETVSFAALRGEEVETRLLSPSFLWAPVEEGRRIEAVFRQSGEICRANLYAENAVARVHAPGFWEKLFVIWKRLLN